MAAKKTDGDVLVIGSVNEYVKGSTTPICPGGGTYIYNLIGEWPLCTGVTNPKSGDGHRFGGDGSSVPKCPYGKKYEREYHWNRIEKKWVIISDMVTNPVYTGK